MLALGKRDTPTGSRECFCQRRASLTGADDDDIKLFHMFAPQNMEVKLPELLRHPLFSSNGLSLWFGQIALDVRRTVVCSAMTRLPVRSVPCCQSVFSIALILDEAIVFKCSHDSVTASSMVSRKKKIGKIKDQTSVSGRLSLVPQGHIGAGGHDAEQDVIEYADPVAGHCKPWEQDWCDQVKVDEIDS